MRAFRLGRGKCLKEKERKRGAMEHVTLRGRSSPMLPACGLLNNEADLIHFQTPLPLPQAPPDRANTSPVSVEAGGPPSRCRSVEYEIE